MKTNYIEDCINIAGNQGHNTEYRNAKEQLRALIKKAEILDQVLTETNIKNSDVLDSLKGDRGELDMNSDPMQTKSFNRGRNAAFASVIGSIESKLKDDTVVHKSHCSKDACKYGDDDCPVVEKSSREGNSFIC